LKRIFVLEVIKTWWILRKKIMIGFLSRRIYPCRTYSSVFDEWKIPIRVNQCRWTVSRNDVEGWEQRWSRWKIKKRKYMNETYFFYSLEWMLFSQKFILNLNLQKDQFRIKQQYTYWSFSVVVLSRISSSKETLDLYQQN
jgi:hypothetical protein